MNFFTLQRPIKLDLSIDLQRKQWLGEFLKAFFVVFFSYMAMYLIRNNFKAGSGSLKTEMGWTTTEIGSIGFIFSLTYAIGKTVLGYFVDGKNTKRIVSALLVLSAIIVMIMGFALANKGAPIAIFMVLWGLNGLFQSVGGPASYSTIARWTPQRVRGKWLGSWNASHNIGGGIAGIFALWGANTFFNGNVYGMFIFPAVIALAIGVIGLFFGKDDPEELGWAKSEVIFNETIEKDNLEAQSMSKWAIFQKYVLGNKWIWLLAIANIFVYIIRIGVDNWSPLYSQEHLGFSKSDAANTLFYFEAGALAASLCWGYISDLIGGRRAIVAAGCLLATFGAIYFYKHASSVFEVNLALFLLGALIFGPQLLIGVSLVGFVPKQSISVANGLTGTFGYLFGDSMAKVGLAAIADPTKKGLSIFGHILHGWSDTFIVLYIAAFLGVAMLILIAFGEENRLKQLRSEK